MHLRKSVASTLIVLATVGCSTSPPSAERLSQEAQKEAQQEAEKKRVREEAEKKRKADLDELVPKLLEKRKPVDQLFGRIWDLLPDAKKLARKDCPDKQILAESPDPSSHGVLFFNKESVFLLTGKVDGRPDGGAETLHTVASYHAFAMRRPSGKETPVIDRVISDDPEKVRAQIEASEFIQKFKYIGVGLFTALHEPDAMASPRPRPQRVEGWAVVFEAKSGKPLCQVEASGEGLVKEGIVTTGSAADEESWLMFLRGAGRNLEGVSKILFVDGFPRKAR